MLYSEKYPLTFTDQMPFINSVQALQAN